MDLPLKHPLELGKITISKLSFRDYTTAADYLSFDKRGGVAQRIALIASLTGTDEALIMKLRGPDYRKAEAIADKMINSDDDDPKPAEGGESAPSTEGGAAEKKSSES